MGNKKTQTKTKALWTFLHNTMVLLLCTPFSFATGSKWYSQEKGHSFLTSSYLNWEASITCSMGFVRESPYCKKEQALLFEPGAKWQCPELQCLHHSKQLCTTARKGLLCQNWVGDIYTCLKSGCDLFKGYYQHVGCTTAWEGSLLALQCNWKLYFIAVISLEWNM